MAELQHNNKWRITKIWTFSWPIGLTHREHIIQDWNIFERSIMLQQYQWDEPGFKVNYDEISGFHKFNLVTMITLQLRNVNYLFRGTTLKQKT